MSALVPEAERSRAAVLRAIALEGPISRSAIAGQLAVSAATVTAITRDLIDAGLVEMSGKAPASGRRGRPSELLSVVPDAVALLGVKVMHDHVIWVQADLRGEVAAGGVVPFDPTGADPADRLGDLLADVVAGVETTWLGVGVGVPGTVATGNRGGEQGRVTSPMFGWDEVPLGARLTARLALPVVVDNDVNTLAVAEHLYGRGRDVDDFLTVTLGRGVGLGIFLDGALRRGGRGGAGELGHTRAVVDGPDCECGRRGCLEAVASDPALVRRAREDGLIATTDGIDELVALAADLAAARDLFAEAGRHIGSAVADLVNLLAPELVVLSGEGIAAWDHIRPGFDEAFAAGVLDVHLATDVVVDPWDDQDWARGAAALVLRSVLAPAPDGDSPETAIRYRLHAIGAEASA